MEHRFNRQYPMILAPDICSVPPDLSLSHLSRDRVIAELGADVGNAGQRLIQTIPKYRDTAIYHQLYLPLNWCPDRFYPVLIEYAGNGSYQNEYGDHCSGLLEDSKLGYGISAGYDFIWLCLPSLNQLGTANVRRWWGDPPNYDPTRTLDYCQWAVDWVCKRYGGDPDCLIITGFSRGAIACNYLGLHNDRIAQLWRAFIVYSHYDGVVESWGYPAADCDSALQRLSRLGTRPQFICHEVVSQKKGKSGRIGLADTRDYLNRWAPQADLCFWETGFRNHNDGWVLRPSPARTALRAWLRSVVEDKSNAEG